MRILILTGEFEPFSGGVGTYARELGLAATRLGHDVTIVAPDYGADQTESDRRLGIRIERFSGGANRPSGILKKMLLVARFSLTRRYDCVHAIDWPFYIPLAVSLFRWRALCMMTFHGTEINVMKRRRRARVLNLIGFWRSWATRIGNSRFTAAHLMKTFPQLDARTVKAIGLGVRHSEDLPVIDKQAARAAADIAPDQFVILSLGRLVERKGHLVLAEALASLPTEIQQRIEWHIVGPPIDPVHVEKIKQRVKSLGVKTVLTGALSDADVEIRLRSADIFCLPGLWDSEGHFEGFGLVYLEAGLRELTSIATDAGGVPDAIVHGETGILVPPGDIQALAAAILNLRDDTVLRQKLAMQARVFAQSCTWERVAEATYGLPS